MSKKRSQPSRSESATKYELKHRLAGAVVLMLVAVVAIPLLLSDPAVEANNGDLDSAEGGKNFKSRIVPLNINNVNGNGEDGSSPATALIGSGQLPVASPDATVIEDNRPALLDLTAPDGGQVVSDDQPAADETGESTQTTMVMTNQVESAETGTDAIEKQPESQQVEAPAPAPAPTETVVAAVKLPEETTSGKGWVVRVGTFSKSANVESVSTLLSSSGFKPKTTAVATSLGQSTRVWLGPYAKRETADKISDRLKALTGEKGYVTRTNS